MKKLLLLSLALILSSPLLAEKSLASLTLPAREVLTGSLAFIDPYYDARAGLIWSPNPSDSSKSRTHRVRESGWYALGLLIRNQPGDDARAIRIIEAILEQQISDSGTAWNGTFYRAPEEPNTPLFPEMWRDYDPNWRQFIGTTFALALIEFESRLPETLRVRMLASIGRAIDGERGHGRLKPSYTNIALMHAFLSAYAGEKLKRPELIREAEALAEAVAAEFKQHGTFEEYNSPTYYGVDFYGLALWRAHGSTPRIRELGAELEAALWRDTAAFYHPGLKNLCGPYDRAYGMDMRQYASLTGLWLRTVFPDETAAFPALDRPMGHAHDFVYAPCFVLLGAKIPEDILEQFTSFSGEHVIERQLPRGRIATAWISENVMLGGEFTGKSRGAGSAQNQFHPATIHWKTPSGATGWMLMTAAPRVDARAEKKRLLISAVGDSTFRINAPGIAANAIAADRWSLPGLTITVQSDATNVTTSSGDGWVDITFREATRIEFHVEE